GACPTHVRHSAILPIRTGLRYRPPRQTASIFATQQLPSRHRMYGCLIIAEGEPMMLSLVWGVADVKIGRRPIPAGEMTVMASDRNRRPVAWRRRQVLQSPTRRFLRSPGGVQERGRLTRRQ